MDIHQMRYFPAVSEALNFTRAAEFCNVTQPALSRAIQQLEDAVGGLLFERKHNSTQLTELGVLMRPRIQQIIDTLMGAKLEAHEFLTLETANITLGITCSIGPSRFTGMLGGAVVAFTALESTPPAELVGGAGPVVWNDMLRRPKLAVSFMNRASSQAWSWFLAAKSCNFAGTRSMSCHWPGNSVR
jgi:LysR family transcriptional regulator, hydrogen peroxide-inducible genes activator